MQFNSLLFILFFCIVFFLYWIVFKGKTKAQNLILLFASYIFYATWDYRFLSLILLSTFIDFIVAKKIASAELKKNKKQWLGISLLVNIGLLFIFKYFNFFIDSFIDLFQISSLEESSFSTLSIILPVGISFYTFQTLSYSIDVYNQKIKPNYSFLDFSLFVAFFPQLVAGPIERAKNLLPQITNTRIFSYNHGKQGLRLILLGFFQKVVIADNLAVFVDIVFAEYSNYNSLYLILGAIAFSFQIYCDFAGYSNIAIGLCKLLGFELNQNFKYPYFSRNVGEFWRRWHISLTTWFRDYLYIPLGGSRVNKNKVLRNTIIVFLISGLWHGANWTFVLWGLLHAILFIPLIYLGANRKYLDDAKLNIRDITSIVLTFILISFLWIIFRSESITKMTSFMSHIFLNYNVVSDLNMDLIQKMNTLIAVFAMTFLLIVEWINRKHFHALYRLPKNFIIRYSIYTFMTISVIEYFYGYSEFIYFQF